MEGNFVAAILLTGLAGVATTVGAAIGVLVGKPGKGFMSITLGLAAGVMIHVSFVELLGEAVDRIGFGYAHLAFFGGMALMFLVDIAIPHEYGAEHDDHSGGRSSRPPLKLGLLVALGIGVHNLPEGLVTFTGALDNIELGMTLAIAVGIHNIPEGIAVSVPVLASTGSRKKAFAWASLSGLAEPVGALLGALILMPILNEMILALTLAGVAGIMVFISLDELLPAAREYGKEHLAIIGAVLGMGIMAFSLWVLSIAT